MNCWILDAPAEVAAPDMAATQNFVESECDNADQAEGDKC